MFAFSVQHTDDGKIHASITFKLFLDQCQTADTKHRGKLRERPQREEKASYFTVFGGTFLPAFEQGAPHFHFAPRSVLKSCQVCGGR